MAETESVMATKGLDELKAQQVKLLGPQGSGIGPKDDMEAFLAGQASPKRWTCVRRNPESCARRVWAWGGPVSTTERRPPGAGVCSTPPVSPRLTPIYGNFRGGEAYGAIARRAGDTIGERSAITQMENLHSQLYTGWKQLMRFVDHADSSGSLIWVSFTNIIAPRPL
eukprot:826461-Amphidinium_carterae.2